ncbi:hypothetical protein MJN54_33270, partial [Salmonella enterica subsp. enterica serovar Kentucky]|nr:hypothetical protein [Salmonella enterica subsp. enterica serovar Kentucky]
DKRRAHQHIPQQAVDHVVAVAFFIKIERDARFFQTQRDQRQRKDGSIAGYETKEPFDPKKEAEKAQQLVEQSRKDIESQRKKAA